MDARVIGRRNTRLLSRATTTAIDDVFSRVGDSGVLRLLQAAEELAARVPRIESAMGDAIPSSELLADFAARDERRDAKMGKEAFTQFVAARLNRHAMAQKEGHHGVRYVGAWEYIRSCSLSSKADESGITRRWRGIESFNPNASMVAAVSVCMVFIAVLVIGVLIGLRADRTSEQLRMSARAVVDTVAVASAATMTQEEQVLLDVKAAEVAGVPAALGSIFSAGMSTYEVESAAAVRNYRAGALYALQSYYTTLDAQLVAALDTLVVSASTLSFARADITESLRVWAAQSSVAARGAIWFDLGVLDVDATLPGPPYSPFAGGSYYTGAARCGLAGSACEQLALRPLTEGTASKIAAFQDNNRNRYRTACSAARAIDGFTGIVCLVTQDRLLLDVLMPSPKRATAAAFAPIRCDAALSATGGITWANTSTDRRVADGSVVRDLPSAAFSARASALEATWDAVAEPAVVFVGALQARATRTAVTIPGFVLGNVLDADQLYVECVFAADLFPTHVTQRVRTMLVSTTLDLVPSHAALTYASSVVGGVQDPVDSPQFEMSRSSATANSAVALDSDGRVVIAAWTHVGAIDVGLVQQSRPTHDAIDESEGFIQLMLARVAGSSGGGVENMRVLFYGDSSTGDLELVSGSTLESRAQSLVEHTARTAFYRTRRVEQSTKSFFVVSQYLPHRNLVVVCVHDVRSTYADTWAALGISIAVALGLCAVAVAALLAVASSVLTHAESDSGDIRVQVDAEKVQFSALIRDAMPPTVLTRFRAGELLISDYYPQLTFFFSDIVSFTERTKFMSNQDLVRFLGYTFMLLDHVAEYYEIHKVKSIGDAFFAVSGLEDKQQTPAGGAGRVTASALSGVHVDHDADPHQHQTYRMVAFAAVSQMLLTPLYHHVPERTHCFEEAAGGVEQPLFKPAPCRIGIHVGPAFAGVFDGGRAPQFDCIGGSVGVCALLESAATPGTIRISEAARRVLALVDVNRDFVCSAPQRTLAKNQGRIETYTIVASFLGVPQAVLEALHIERSVKRRTFGEGGFLLDEVDRTGKLKDIGDEAESHIISESEDDD
jgi:class 3 adenylate cyclase